MKQQIVKNKTFSIEVPIELDRQVRLAAALLGQSRGKFIREATEEKLNRINLPELEVLKEATCEPSR